MIRLSAEEAFAAYEAVRHRLPVAAQADRAACHARSLEDVAEGFDAFLLDAFGVLNIGEQAIPGTGRRIDDLRAAGKRVLVVSNAASVPHSALVEKYRRLGYDFPAEDIVTSRSTLAVALASFDRLHWGVMGVQGSGLKDLGGLRTILLGDDLSAYRGVDGFLLIGSGTWTEARQARLEEAIAERIRPVLVANPDIVAPREGGLSAEPGYFAHRLADRTGINPVFFGKPFPEIFQLAFDRLGPIDRRRILMVGDSLHTDILGAHAAGVSSALITRYGFFAGQDARAAVANTRIVPDYLVDRP